MKKADPFVAPIFVAVVSLLAIGAVIESVASLFNRSKVQTGEQETNSELVIQQAI